MMYQLLLIALLAASAYGCGQTSYPPYSSKVVNGVDARPYSWPWQISLKVGYGSSFSHTCGGTLISTDWVMTAGHCISAGRSYQVVLGEYDRHVVEGGEQVISAAKIIVHPRWSISCISCGNDIALIKLAKPAQLNDKVAIACIPPAGYLLPNDFYCYITGWGRLYTNGPLPGKLQQAHIPVIDYEHCSQSDWWGSVVKTTMICAGGAEKAGCNGDSGGPLNCRDSNGLWYVHGVTSFVSSLGCSTIKKPTVWTRVSAFNDWIAQVSILSN
ncbi:proproteinase E-like isoform X3 [Heterodontus francisci]|uniref:proproteinase E-like isoform X3 n=1 Tax=Heterodontus francisci TaxID=7792 RepID=UPI00355BCFF9